MSVKKCRCGGDVDVVTKGFHLEVIEICRRCQRRVVNDVVVNEGITTRPAQVPLKR